MMLLQKTWLALLVVLAVLRAGADVEPEPAVEPEPLPNAREWTLADRKIVGVCDGMTNDLVYIRTVEAVESLPFDTFAPADQRRIVNAADQPDPRVAPPWMKGYKVRYLLRLMDDPLEHAERRTVIASIPTGGWLKEDASDLRVVTVSGAVLPTAILSHDPMGNTLLQFTRNGMDRWYWVYAVNPSAPPQVDESQRRKIAATYKAAQDTMLKTMELRRQSAEAAGELRDLRNRLKRERQTLEKVEGELAKLDQLIPKRQEELKTARAAVPPLEADEKKLLAELNRAEARANDMLEKVKQAEQRAAEAETAAKAEAERQSAEARRAASITDPLERQRVQNAATARLHAARQTAVRRKAQIGEAEEAAVPVRMEAAGAKTAHDAAIGKLNQARRRVTSLEQTMGKLQEQRKAALELRNATRKQIAEMEPRETPLETLATRASQQATAAAERAKKLEADHHAMSLASDPRTHREGLSLEVRDWSGDLVDELGSWPAVVEGLMRSDNVIGNAAIMDVLQKMNPFRLGDTRNFAASYRGFLNIEKPGLYRFFLNADDASFLFLNEYLVLSRVGPNRTIQGRMNVFAVGQDMELDAGVYRLEIHQVTGNSPGAYGRCAFYWIPPEAESWQRVPPQAFVPALSADLVRVEAPDGKRVPIPVCGVANTLGGGGTELFLVQCRAVGASEDQRIAWTFGDKMSGEGVRLQHVYFEGGDYEISMRAPNGLPPFKQRLHVWNAPVPTSPLALGEVVDVLDGYDLARLDEARLGAAFAFLSICGQSHRWPVVDKVAARLLESKGLDLPYRVALYRARMEALARQGRAADALELGQEALAETGTLHALRLDVQLKIADIHRLHLRDFDEAGRLYAAMVEEYRRMALPAVRRAAIAWGDMYLDIGDNSRASEIYRLAGSLGGSGDGLGKATDATTRGALLRVAEQQMRDGNLRHSRQLLERIEQEYPEQKVEGLYRFLRAEADRQAGRYVEAERNYELLLRMQQWAGYRAQALQGLADCAMRREHYTDAVKWLDAIAESYPDFYRQRELATSRDVAAARLENDPETLDSFAGIEDVVAVHTNVAANMPLRSLPLHGLGDRALVLNRPTDRGSSFYEFSLDNVVSEGAYWIDFWYRNDFVNSHGWTHPRLTIECLGEENRKGEGGEVPVIRTFGLHFHGAALVRMPVTRDGKIRMVFDSFQGLQRLHGLRVRPVSALQEEALQNFIEGVDTL